MLLMFKARINKPADMSNKDFYTVWRKESEAALGAKEAGVIKGIWKVAGNPKWWWSWRWSRAICLTRRSMGCRSGRLAMRILSQTLKCCPCARTKTGPKI